MHNFILKADDPKNPDNNHIHINFNSQGMSHCPKCAPLYRQLLDPPLLKVNSVASIVTTRPFPASSGKYVIFAEDSRGVPIVPIGSE